MKPSLKALGLLFVMVMINSENAAGLQKSATIAEFEKTYGNKDWAKDVTKPHLLEEGSICHVPSGPCCQRLIDLYKEKLMGLPNLPEYPECDMSGYFKSRQCSNSGADCKCVNYETGVELHVGVELHAAPNDLCPGEEEEDYERGGDIPEGFVVNYVYNEPTSGTQGLAAVPAVTIIGHSYTVFMKPGKMFLLVQEKVTWYEARIQCQARHGDLAVLPTFKEIDLVTKKIGHLFGSHEGPWIGAHRNPNIPHEFEWITGEAIAQNFGYWAVQPNPPGSGVALVITGFWRKTDAADGIENSALVRFESDDKREGYLCEIN